ncbi:unnamed protein product [Brassicogethes aeneus]|uniref:Bis(5'-nucleosyl)-tetraphosphatase [asymmetrical] n=1 Tax=Brassicogethes aeneus TaxID=1431903 RepID=A0A9P0AV74_BRAAE|nr:unnamed protein product [Brassicogethes aeneus]
MVKTATGFVIFRTISNKIEYLLLQTSYGVNHWTPPKGHMDPGETEMQTAYRETNEESGLKPDDYKVYEDCKQTLNYDVKGKPKIVIYWLAKLVNDKAEVKLSHEHIAYKWLTLQDACQVVEYEETRTLMKNCEEYIKSHNLA